MRGIKHVECTSSESILRVGVNCIATIQNAPNIDNDYLNVIKAQ